jgi:hypothetical protein
MQLRPALHLRSPIGLLAAMAVVLAAAVGLAVTGTASASVASTAVAGHVRVALETPSSFSNIAQSARQNSYVVLQAWEAGKARELEAANPNVVVLVYQNLSAMAQGSAPEGLHSSGVSFEEATSAHPDWFLTSTSGQRISEGGYSWLWMADIGNAGYQQAWLSNVLSLLAHGPWDGVFLDDTNTTAKYHTDPSQIAAYPTDAAYQSAVRSMLAYVGPGLKAAGKLAIPNIGSWSEYPEVAKEWLQFVDGGMDEMFAKWSTTPGYGYRYAAQWKTQIEEIATTESMHKVFLAVTQAADNDPQAIRYGWASTLLAAQGHTSYVAAQNYSEETWTSEYNVELGAPTSAGKELSGGAWARTFANGLVVVNPTASTVHVELGGVYSGSGLTNATSADLAPDSALILTGSSTSPVSASAGPESPLASPGSPSSSGASPNPVPSSPGDAAGQGSNPPSPGYRLPSAASPPSKPGAAAFRSISLTKRSTATEKSGSSKHASAKRTKKSRRRKASAASRRHGHRAHKARRSKRHRHTQHH